MHKSGHIGLSLLILSGLTYLLGLPSPWAVWLCVGGAAISSIPDWDIHWRRHRGFTHSLFFVGFISVGLGLVTWLAWSVSPQFIINLADEFGIHSNLPAFAFGFAPVAGGLLTHLAGDACTYSGVPLLWPRSKHYSLRLCSSSNLVVNWGLALAGVCAFFLLMYSLGMLV